MLAPWEIKTFFFRGKSKNHVFMCELGMVRDPDLTLAPCWHRWHRGAEPNIGILVSRSDGATVPARVKRISQSHIFFLCWHRGKSKRFFFRGKSKNHVFMCELGMVRDPDLTLAPCWHRWHRGKYLTNLYLSSGGARPRTFFFARPISSGRDRSVFPQRCRRISPPRESCLTPLVWHTAK